MPTPVHVFSMPVTSVSAPLLHPAWWGAANRADLLSQVLASPLGNDLGFLAVTNDYARDLLVPDESLTHFLDNTEAQLIAYWLMVYAVLYQSTPPDCATFSAGCTDVFEWHHERQRLVEQCMEPVLSRLRGDPYLRGRQSRIDLCDGRMNPEESAAMVEHLGLLTVLATVPNVSAVHAAQLEDGAAYTLARQIVHGTQAAACTSCWSWQLPTTLTTVCRTPLARAEWLAEAMRGNVVPYTRELRCRACAIDEGFGSGAVVIPDDGTWVAADTVDIWDDASRPVRRRISPATPFRPSYRTDYDVCLRCCALLRRGVVHDCPSCIQQATARTSSRGAYLPSGRVEPHNACYPTELRYLPEEGRSGLPLTYFGVELEVEYQSAPPDRVRAVLERLPAPCTLKHDGSLANGIEIVTAPTTLAQWRADLPRWKEFLRGLRKAGVRSFDPGTCGMHIHVSRTAFSPTATLRLQRLVFGNAAFFQLLAQRSSNYAQFPNIVPKRLTAVTEAMKERARSAINTQYSHRASRMASLMDAGHGAGVHYDAVGFPSSKPTVEFRIFRGTLHYASFVKNLETVAACVAFTNTHATAAMNAQDFVRFVLGRATDYPHLAAFIAAKLPQFIMPAIPVGTTVAAAPVTPFIAKTVVRLGTFHDTDSFTEEADHDSPAGPEATAPRTVLPSMEWLAQIAIAPPTPLRVDTSRRARRSPNDALSPSTAF